EFIIEKLKEIDLPVFLVINKIDLVHPDELLPLITEYNDKFSFAETVPVSALNGNNVETLRNVITDYLPEGPQYYSKKDKTDRSLQFHISEIDRKSTRLNSSHVSISYAVFCLKKKRLSLSAC